MERRGKTSMSEDKQGKVGSKKANNDREQRQKGGKIIPEKITEADKQALQFDKATTRDLFRGRKMASEKTQAGNKIKSWGFGGDQIRILQL